MDSKVKHKTDSKLKPKTDSKVKPKTDSKVKPKTDSKVEPKPDSKVKHTNENDVVCLPYSLIFVHGEYKRSSFALRPTPCFSMLTGANVSMRWLFVASIGAGLNGPSLSGTM